jgi:ATP phosphoribosyltransferase regulatory subunit HisZ
MGGRYDALLRAFGSDLPAVGFSLSMDSVMEGT